MYVVRHNVKVKRGYVPAVLKLLKSWHADIPRTTRLYTNVFGDNDIVIGEVEFEDIKEAAAHVEWVESSETQEEIRANEWYDISAGNQVELWKIV